MDDHLVSLTKLKETQDCVITLRTEIPRIYCKYLRKECNLRIKKMLASDINIEENIDKLENDPQPTINIMHRSITNSQLDNVINYSNNTKNAFKYLNAATE